MNNFTINCLGFDDQQKVSIEAVLDLGSSALSSSWGVVDYTNSDVIMINMDNTEDFHKYAEHKDNSDVHIILTAEEKQLGNDDHWFLFKKQQTPPSLRELVQLLNKIDASLQDIPAKVFLNEKALQTDNNSINKKVQPSEELSYAEMNLDLDNDWLKMLDTEKW